MLTGQVDPQLLQPADVLHPGEVEIDQVAGDITRRGEGVEGMDEVRVLVLGPENILFVFGGELHIASVIFEVDFIGILRVRVGQEKIVLLQVNIIQSKLLPLV